MSNKALIDAIKFFGSQQKMAEALGVSRKLVNHWLNKSIRLPVQYAFFIEVLTSGKVEAEKLSPHLSSHIASYKTFLKGK